jgi:hypothetical protein
MFEKKIKTFLLKSKHNQNMWQVDSSRNGQIVEVNVYYFMVEWYIDHTITV